MNTVACVMDLDFRLTNISPPLILWVNFDYSGALFIEQVKEWFEETTLADSARINRFCAAFPAGDAVIQKMLGDYLWESISV